MTALEILREGLDAAARRYHALAQQYGHSEHRHWKFQHCPAATCVDARLRIDFAAYLGPTGEAAYPSASELERARIEGLRRVASQLLQAPAQPPAARAATVSPLPKTEAQP